MYKFEIGTEVTGQSNFYGHLDDFVEGATHYHAHYVNPSWAETKTYITRIDDHIFYRWDIER